jgi:hypothetical protein
MPHAEKRDAKLTGFCYSPASHPKDATTLAHTDCQVIDGFGYGGELLL